VFRFEQNAANIGVMRFGRSNIEQMRWTGARAGLNQRIFDPMNPFFIRNRQQRSTRSIHRYG